MEKKLKWRKSDSIFYQTILMLSLLSLITLAAMFFFVTSIVAGNQKNRFRTIHRDQIQQVSAYVDGQIHALEQTSGQILHSKDAVSLMVNSKLRNSDVGYRVISTLKNTTAQNELIRKAFLYLPTTGEVYSSAGNFLSVKDSGNRKDVEEYLADRKKNRDPAAESETRLLYRNHALFVVTDFCVPNHIGTLFLELNLDILNQTIQSGASSPEDSFLLIDSGGELILCKEEILQEAKGVLREGVSLRTDSSHVPKGAREDYLVSPAGAYGLSYGIHTNPKSERVSPGTLALTLVPFLVIYALVSFLFSLYITGRIYRPINRLMQITEAEQKDMSRIMYERGKNELDYVEEALQNTLGENRQHKELLELISQDVLNQMFRGILTGTQTDQAYIRGRMEGLGLSQYLSGRYMALAGRIFPVQKRELTTVEEGLYRRSLLAALSECVRDSCMMVFFFVDEETLALLLCFPSKESAIYMKTQAAELAGEIREELSQLPYTVTFGRGGIYNEITSLRFSFQEAVEDLNYQNYLKDNPQQEGRERPLRQQDADVVYFRKQSAHLAELAEKERLEDLEVFTASMVRELCNLDPGRRPEILDEMMDVLEEKMVESHVTPEEILGMNLNERVTALFRNRDVEKEEEEITELLMSAARAIHSFSRKNRFKYVDSAKKYISEHYSDGNLSLNEVSDAVGISAPYLSAIFAEINKGGFSSYLSSFRVESAKSFLTETTQNVAEIGYRCGFNSAQSFSRVFKKNTGMTPGQYRDKHHAGNGGGHQNA